MSRQKSAERVIQALQRALLAHPHQRVGQLIDNACYTIDKRVFYVTNETLAMALDEYASGSK